jgi:hypothetical protein
MVMRRSKIVWRHTYTLLEHRFQAKGMDIGVTDDSLNGIPYEESSTSSEEEEEVEAEEGEADRDLIRSNRKQRERPVSFSKMGDIKCRSVPYCKRVLHSWHYTYGHAFLLLKP